MNSIKRYFVLFVLAGTGCTLVFNLYLEYSQYVTSTARLESNSNSIKKVSLTRWQQQGTNSDGDSGTQQPPRGSKSALVQDSSNDSSNSTGKQQAASSFPLVMKDEKHILPGGRWSANMNLNPWHYIQSGRRPDLAPKLKVPPGNSPSVLILIASTPTNFDQRKIVRDVWGCQCRLNHDNCDMAFVVGRVNEEDPERTQKSLVQESKQYGDILQGSFMDSYNNLTLKSAFLLDYFYSQAKAFSMVMKGDDDSYLSVKIMLKKYLWQLGMKKDFIAGSLRRNKDVRPHHLNRFRNKVWSVPKDMLSRNVYPPHMEGCGYIISRDAAACILKGTRTVPLIQVEDAYITGLAAEQCAKSGTTELINIKGIYVRSKMMGPSAYKGNKYPFLIHKAASLMATKHRAQGGNSTC